MAYSFSNTSSADQHVTSTELDLVSNYALIQDEPQVARISNKTASLEQPELITFRCVPQTKVSNAIPVRNPAPTQNGVQYSVKLETIARFTVGTEVVDEPVAAWLTIKHPSSNNWDNAAVALIVNRLLSACIKGQTHSGTAAEVASAEWRFEDLMRSALKPVVD